MAAAVAQIQARAEILKLRPHCPRRRAVAVPELRVGTAIVLVDVRAETMSELRLQSLPSVLLARDILPVLTTIGEIEAPEIKDALGSRLMELVKDLIGYRAGVTKVSRPSRDATTSRSLSDREGVFATVFDELVFSCVCEHSASNLSTSLAGIRISLPSRKPASSPQWNI